MQLQDALDVQIYDALTREHRADKAARYMITYFGYDGDLQILAERIDDLVTIIRHQNRQRGLIMLIVGSLTGTVGTVAFFMLPSWEWQHDITASLATIAVTGIGVATAGICKAVLPMDYDAGWWIW